MSKSSQSQKDSSCWKRIPIIRTLLRRREFRARVQEDLLQIRNTRDPKELAETVPPESEIVEFHCAWITEVYGPSQIDELVMTLKKMGWNKPEDDVGHRDDLTTWIKQCRGLGLRSSWMNGGIILSSNDNRSFFGPDIRRTKLPKGVDYARLSIRNMTSSLTLVTIQFVFNDEIANSLNQLFNETYSTNVDYCPSSLRSKMAVYVGAVEQKRQAIRKRLDEIHSSLYAWFRHNLPGYFSSLPQPASFPTLDLITSRLYEQPEDNTAHPPDHYTDLMFDYAVDIWKCETDTNLEFRLPSSHKEEPTSVLFGNYEKLMPDTDMYGGRDRSALTTKLHMEIDVFMSLWATHNLLLSYEQQLSAIRDKAIVQNKGTRKAIKNLEYVRDHFLTLSKDIRAISNDVSVSAKEKNRFGYDALDFSPPHYLKEYSYTFVEILRQNAEIRTEQLLQLEPHVNDAISSSSNLTSAMTNLRIQRSVLALTILIAIMTLISILLLFWDKIPH